MKYQHQIFFITLCIVSLALSQLIKLDSLGHFIGFFALTWLLHKTFKFPLINLVLCLIVYSALTEVGQYYLGFRRGEFRDFLADLAGIGFFILVSFIVTLYGKKYKV